MHAEGGAPAFEVHHGREAEIGGDEVLEDLVGPHAPVVDAPRSADDATHRPTPALERADASVGGVDQHVVGHCVRPAVRVLEGLVGERDTLGLRPVSGDDPGATALSNRREVGMHGRMDVVHLIRKLEVHCEPGLAIVFLPGLVVRPLEEHTEPGVLGDDAVLRRVAVADSIPDHEGDDVSATKRRHAHQIQPVDAELRVEPAADERKHHDEDDGVAAECEHWGEFVHQPLEPGREVAFVEWVARLDADGGR